MADLVRSNHVHATVGLNSSHQQVESTRVESKHLPDTIEFNRPAKFKALKRLGAGACGETILIHDENMDCNFVAKKYSPFFSQKDAPDDFIELLRRFNHEAKILFRLNHPNIVRVFNYYDYSEHGTAYILMEYVDGENITDFSRQNPSMLDGIFEKVVDGFVHLESKNILHRDIRPLNILVDDDGNPKIIDFGFGKNMEGEIGAADKSISLNWWCEVPPEFLHSIYDFQTEVYFVGKLFEQIIVEEALSDFKYKKIVSSMCLRNRTDRFSSFSDVKSSLSAGKFETLSFSIDETRIYRKFSDTLIGIISSIEQSTKYERDNAKIILGLEAVYRRSMLEEHVPDASSVAQIFLQGPFRYWTRNEFETDTLQTFLTMLKSLQADKQSIVLENLLSRLDAVQRSKPKSPLDDDIPF